ncbi:MAG: hypothetical protein ABII68_11980 [Pseudomonadota bacterium]
MEEVVIKEVRVKDRTLQIELPEGFKDKSVEAIIRLKRDIEKEILADKIKIDTTKWKFDRAEAHGR